MKMNTKQPTLMEHNESSIKNKIHSTKCFHKEIGEIPYNQMKCTPKSSRTERSKHTQKEETARNSQTSLEITYY